MYPTHSSALPPEANEKSDEYVAEASPADEEAPPTTRASTHADVHTQTATRNFPPFADAVPVRPNVNREFSKLPAIAQPIYVPKATEYGLGLQSHALSLLTTGFLAAGIALFAIGFASGDIIFYVALGCYLIECFIVPMCHGSTFYYLYQIATEGESDTAFELMRQAAPSIVMHNHQYHNETHHYTDSNGHHHSRTERVTTHTDSRPIFYSSWVDVSGPTPSVAGGGKKSTGSFKYSLLKVKVRKDWMNVDDFTTEAIEEQRDAFHMDNPKMDTYSVFTEELMVPNYKSNILICAGKKPFWVSWKWYVFFSLILLTFPYRMYIEYISFRANFDLVKNVTVSPEDRVDPNASTVTTIPGANGGPNVVIVNNNNNNNNNNNQVGYF